MTERKERRTLELAHDTEVISTVGGALRNRETEEPIGRWMNRCTFIRKVDGFQYMVCDRKREHRGLHQGRLYDFNTARHLGWAVVR
jgi:hypothetical protein